MSISPPVGQSDDVTHADGQTEHPYGTWTMSKTHSEPMPHCSVELMRTLLRLFGYRTVELLSTLMTAFWEREKRAALVRSFRSTRHEWGEANSRRRC